MARVLVVDDEPDSRLLASIILNSEGHSVTEAGNGEEALESIAADRPDVVLLDIRMPVLDGWGVIERLREQGVIANLKVIMLSAHTGADVADHVAESGAYAFLSKPYTWQQLIDVVDASLADKG